MKEVTEKLLEQVDETIESTFEASGGICSVVNKSTDDEWLTFKRLMSVYETSKEYSMELADTLDRIEMKLDKLLACENEKET